MRVATNYTITDRRLHIKRGIVSRTIQETRLERVQNVNYSQTVVQRMLQVGDVDFDTAAGDDYNFVFNGVADPGDVVHMVDQATQRRRDRGPRRPARAGRRRAGTARLSGARRRAVPGSDPPRPKRSRAERPGDVALAAGARSPASRDRRTVRISARFSGRSPLS